MNDPFYNLYSIIENHQKGKINSVNFNSLGSNNPDDLHKTKPAHNIVDYFNNQKNQFLILHDQEPIMFSKYLSGWKNAKRVLNRIRTDHILSNSEVNSNEKDLFLKFTGWRDFYWFSNAFLALEWYRHYQYATYFENSFNPKYHFSSYNRLIDTRAHRIILSGLLLSHNPKIILSCETVDAVTKRSATDILNSDNIPNRYHSYFGNVINYGSNIKINTTNYGTENRAFAIEENDFMDSFCHIITERIFFEERIHLTEKTFRPIVCCRPFILASSPGALQYLKNYGFKTFDRYWDESYDKERNHFKRLDKIIDVIEKLSQLSVTELHNMLLDMKETLIYNRNHFYSTFREYITAELLSNLNKVIVDTNPRNGNLFEIIKNLTPEQLMILKNGNEAESLDFPPPFNQYNFINATQYEKELLFKRHEKYFRLIYNITKIT